MGNARRVASVVAVGILLVALPLAFAGLQRPGDSNQDGRLDVGDVVHFLRFLFTDQVSQLPCGAGTSLDAGNVALLDFNGDSELDLADAVAAVLYLFSGGSSHVLGIVCTDVPGCENTLCDDTVRYSDVQPIFEAKCTPCHAGFSPGFCSGGPCFVNFYGDTQQDAAIGAFARCPGLKVYQCIPRRIENGEMPNFAGCSGDPARDTQNAACLTRAQLDLVRAWADRGGLE